MPRYFFHRDDHDKDIDTEGTELPDLGRARMEAVAYAGAYMRDHPQFAWDGSEFRIHVSDESGAMRFTVVVLAVDYPEVPAAGGAPSQ